MDDRVTLLIGLVTHARSRFNERGAAEARVRALADELVRLGLSVEVLISDRDDADAGAVTSEVLRRSARYQARVEHAWRRALAVAGGSPAAPAWLDRLRAWGMAARRLERYRGAAGRRAVTRLMNIDLSHLRVLEAGAEADWVLVLEDDAIGEDLASVGVLALVTAPELADVSFVCCSESIAVRELGIEGLLDEADPVPVPDLPGRVVRARWPVTNTVCANLYRGPFARQLADRIRTHGLVPVAPIDWRLNAVVMDLAREGALGARSCVWVRPGLFRQASMHSAAPTTAG